MTAFAPAPACPPACAVIGRHVTTCPCRPVDYGRRYCPNGHGLQTVEDVDPHASQMTASGEEEWTGTYLACGCTLTENPRIVGPAPGAPYAGPGVAVAASSRPRDLRAAQRLQDRLDHPYGPEFDQ